MLDLVLALAQPAPPTVAASAAQLQLAQARPQPRALPPAPASPPEFTSSNPDITKGMGVSFQDEFDAPKVSIGQGGRWSTTYFWGARTMAPNKEEQLYVDPTFKTESGVTPGIDPFEVKNGVLSIVARRTPDNLLKDLGGMRYTSGLLTSYRSFRFRYGFVEFRAKMPRGRSMWPAVWMLRSDKGSLGELDIAEVFGQRTNFLNSTIHAVDGGEKRAVLLVRRETQDLAADFHIYGLHWTEQKVTVYLDGKEMGSAPTPEGLRGPMYLLVNLAVGGKWPGPTNENTPAEARFEMDYLRVWQSPEDRAANPGAGG